VIKQSITNTLVEMNVTFYVIKQSITNTLVEMNVTFYVTCFISNYKLKKYIMKIGKIKTYKILQ